MNGSALESGAVGAVKNYPHAISIARKVVETLPHVMLVGAGAERFAAEMGFPRKDWLTDQARAIWAKRLQRDMPPHTFSHLQEQTDLRDWVQLATDPERARGTVNFIAQDANGDIACGVSTSGWAWKYPGRLGDSPIIGAGNYADNRYGAAACTGMGEMAIRGATAHSIVFYVKTGLSLVDAGRRAMQDLNDLGGRFLSSMRIITLDKDGNHAAFSSLQDTICVYQRSDMSAPTKVARTYVPIRSRWG
jgi:beta-aspartyl-peptidase (threonine type)